MLLKPENKDKLVSILTYHVVPGKILSGDVKAGKVKMLNGDKARITVADYGINIDNARIVQTDITASNGVIHVIDNVILPQKG